MPPKRDTLISDGCYFWNPPPNCHEYGLKGTWLRDVPSVHSNVEVSSLSHAYWAHSKTSHEIVFEGVYPALLFIVSRTLEQLINLGVPHLAICKVDIMIYISEGCVSVSPCYSNAV